MTIRLIYTQTRSDSVMMGKPVETNCDTVLTMAPNSTKINYRPSHLDLTCRYNVHCGSRAVLVTTSKSGGGQASPGTHRGFGNSKQRTDSHMANCWLAMDVLRKLDEANARYFALTLHSPSLLYYLVSSCCHLGGGVDGLGLIVEVAVVVWARNSTMGSSCCDMKWAASPFSVLRSVVKKLTVVVVSGSMSIAEGMSNRNLPSLSVSFSIPFCAFSLSLSLSPPWCCSWVPLSSSSCPESGEACPRTRKNYSFYCSASAGQEF